MDNNVFSYKDSFEKCLDYFNGNDLASSVFLDKYALRDKKGNLLEDTPEKMHKRISKEFSRIQKKKYGKKGLSEEEVFKLLDKFKTIIPQGSPMFGIGNKYQLVSTSNCFVVPSPLDSYSGILKTDEQIVQISKRRGGVGTDLSNLRPKGAPTQNAARSSTGIVSFMNRYSNSTREVGQNGRRGALMLTLSIHHPESVVVWDEKIDGKPYEVEIKHSSYGNFKISSKFYNPKKIDFVTSKYDDTKVTGANISLRLTDEFLEAVKNDDYYEQRWPVDSPNPIISKKVKARDAWEKIIHSAWLTAEPGLLFWDNIQRESIPDCYSDFGFKSTSTNPCSELILSPYDSCRLLAINLFDFVVNPFKRDSYFDYKRLYEVSQVAQRLMDDLVDIEIECAEKIIDKIKNDPEDQETKRNEINLWESIKDACEKGRRTGTGITALGDVIAALGFGYGSKNSVDTVDKIYKTIKFGCYKASTDMAKEVSPFSCFDKDLEKNNDFINRIKGESLELNDGTVIEGKDIVKEMEKYGRRNIALLTTAPTGSISLLAKIGNFYGVSSGIEPQFSIEPYTRKKKINPDDENVKVDEIDSSGDSWHHYKVYNSSLKAWMESTGNKDYTKSPWFGFCAHDLNWGKRVDIQSAATKHVCHSISSTINIKSETEVDEVKKIYECAWENNLKGITVYREGCRSGVLVKDKDDEVIQKTKAPKRPQRLWCEVHHPTLKNIRYYVAVGLFGGDPYEVFIGLNYDNEGEIFIPKSVKDGFLYKKSRGKYILETGKDEDSQKEYLLTNGNSTDESIDTITRLISVSLRHGADISYIVHQLEKSEGNLTSFSKVLARTLKKYIADGTMVSGEKCLSCGSEKSIIRQEGCIRCSSCGWTKCA